MATICTRCGFNNPSGMRYCGNCGTRLEDVAVSEDAQKVAPSVSLDNLGVMMGSDLIERMRRAGLEAAGQRRNVTVLFADISGFTALSEKIDGEDLFDMVQEYIRLLSNNVYKYEGIVDKLTGDGLMALFGAPISHENNAERAVRAALDMQTDLVDLSRDLKRRLGFDLNVRIGIHSGAVIVGGIGSNMLMNYTAIGDTVNLAHRIEEAAPPGTTLISEAVYRQVRVIFDCQQISVLNPKGIAHPVVAYRVTGLKVVPGSVRGIEGLHAPMIGRDEELILLKQAVTHLIQDKQGQFILIMGEAGLGKSRLTAELKAWLDQSRVRILEGQSLAYRRTIPYWIVREMLYSYLGLLSSAPLLQVRERLGQYVYQLMGSEANEALPYLEHLLSLPYSDPASAEHMKHLDPQQLRQQIFLTVRDLLMLESYNRPLLLIMDDLHWADEASLELLAFLLEFLRQAPIFVLAISRDVLPVNLEKAVAWASQNLDERFRKIHLQNLSLDQSAQLLFLLLTIPDFPEHLRESILQRAAGIPFYLEEILRMFIDEGIIRQEDGRWQVVPGVDIDALGVPTTLKDLILARFDRLTVNQKYILQVASVIGKNFSLPVLTQVLRTTEPQALQSTLDLLVERQFILLRTGATEPDFTFRHVLTSDVIYGTMLRKERSILHGQVGDVIEVIYADRLDEQIELLANHYRWSPKLDRALHYLILAGQKAARNHINEQARQHYEAGLELLPLAEHQPYQALQIYMGLGDALIFAGAYPDARQKFQEALQVVAAVQAESYAEERSSLYRKIANTYERQGEYDQAMLFLNRAQKSLDFSPQPHPVERAEVLRDIGWIHFRRGNFVEAEQFLQDALRLAESAGVYGVIASIYNRLGGIAYNQGNWDRAADFLRKSIDIREAIGDVVGLASSSNNLGYMEIELGQFDNALEDLTRNFELVIRLGQVEGIAVAYNNLGWLHILRGDTEEAEIALRNALELSRQIGYSSLLREVLKNIGELYLVLQNWDKARESLSELALAFKELGANNQLLHTYRLLGEASLGAGDIPSAVGWAKMVDEVASTFDQGAGDLPAIQFGEILRFRGMLATYLGNWQDAEKFLRESEKMFQKLRSRLYLGRTIFQLGVLAERQGNLEPAYDQYNQASQIFQSIGAKLEARRAEEAYKAIRGNNESATL